MEREMVMVMATMNGHKKMTKALDILNKTVQDKKNEIGDNLEHFKKTAHRSLGDVKESVVDKVEAVDKEMHSNPWAYIAGATACALLAGFIVGRITKK
jgi:ElaB/YqjD/DUF883 family membrane-anchored ribosome-binding protein